MSGSFRGAATLRRAVPWILAGWFAAISATFILGPALRGQPLWFGWDAVVYTHAARELLTHGDPWSTVVFGIFFAAPPTGLLPFVPFVGMPDDIVAGTWVAIGLASSVYSVRKLGLPLWWLLFPPLVVGISAGSTAPAVLALLVRAGLADDLRGMAANAIAILLRPYAALPTLLLGRWRALLLAANVVLITAPLLAWGAFFANLPGISLALHNQSSGGVSAAVSPGLFLIAVVGLIALGRRRAAWLIVPALWPDAQLYYASIALPVLAEMPIVAIAIASPATPGLIAFGIAVQCAIEGLSLRRLRRRSLQHSTRRWAPDALVARYARRGAPGGETRPASVDRR